MNASTQMIPMIPFAKRTSKNGFFFFFLGQNMKFLLLIEKKSPYNYLVKNGSILGTIKRF